MSPRNVAGPRLSDSITAANTTLIFWTLYRCPTDAPRTPHGRPTCGPRATHRHLIFVLRTSHGHPKRTPWAPHGRSKHATSTPYGRSTGDPRATNIRPMRSPRTHGFCTDTPCGYPTVTPRTIHGRPFISIPSSNLVCTSVEGEC